MAGLLDNPKFREKLLSGSLVYLPKRVFKIKSNKPSQYKAKANVSGTKILRPDMPVPSKCEYMVRFLNYPNVSLRPQDWVVLLVRKCRVNVKEQGLDEEFEMFNNKFNLDKPLICQVKFIKRYKTYCRIIVKAIMTEVPSNTVYLDIKTDEAAFLGFLPVALWYDLNSILSGTLTDRVNKFYNTLRAVFREYKSLVPEEVKVYKSKKKVKIDISFCKESDFINAFREDNIKSFWKPYVEKNYDFNIVPKTYVFDEEDNVFREKFGGKIKVNLELLNEIRDNIDHIEYGWAYFYMFALKYLIKPKTSLKNVSNKVWQFIYDLENYVKLYYQKYVDNSWQCKKCSCLPLILYNLTYDLRYEMLRKFFYRKWREDNFNPKFTSKVVMTYKKLRKELSKMRSRFNKDKHFSTLHRILYDVKGENPTGFDEVAFRAKMGLNTWLVQTIRDLQGHVEAYSTLNLRTKEERDKLKTFVEFLMNMYDLKTNNINEVYFIIETYCLNTDVSDERWKKISKFYFGVELDREGILKSLGVKEKFDEIKRLKSIFLKGLQRFKKKVVKVPYSFSDEDFWQDYNADYERYDLKRNRKKDLMNSLINFHIFGELFGYLPKFARALKKAFENNPKLCFNT